MARIGSLTRYELLGEMINERGYCVVAEIGVWKAQTTEYILRNCPSVTRYYAVEYRPTYINLRDDRLEVLEGFSVEMAKEVEDNSVDVVFIDADHCYEAIINDINAWLPKIKQGGIIGGHDYLNSHHRWCEKAVDDYFGKENVCNDEDALMWWVNVKGDLINNKVDARKYPSSLSSEETRGGIWYD